MNHLNKFKKIYLAILMPLSLGACTTIQPLSAENQKQIHSLTLNKQVEEPKTMMLMDPSISYVGPIIGGIASESEAKKLQASAKKNGYSPAKIMLTELKQSIQNNTKFQVTDDQSKADAIIQLRILNYGFAVPHGFALSMVPCLSVEATMLRNGLQVWHFKNYQPITNAKRVTVAQLESDPKSMYASWDEAAKIIAKQMTASM